MMDVMAFHSYDTLRDINKDADIENARHQNYEFVLLREKMIR